MVVTYVFSRSKPPYQRNMEILRNFCVLGLIILSTFLKHTIAYPQDVIELTSFQEGNDNTQEIRSVKLLAKNANIKSESASLLPGDKIGGWTDTSAEISWEVTITHPGQIEVVLGLANTESTSGAVIEIAIGDTIITGTTVCSGGLMRVKDMNMGTGTITKTGTLAVSVKSTHINGGDVGHLYYLIITGYVSTKNEEITSFVEDIKLTPDIAKLSMPSCTKISQQKLYNWTDSALRITWLITVNTPGKVDVYFALANNEEQAGVKVHILIGNDELIGITKYSGGLNEVSEMRMGTVLISQPGTVIVELRAEEISSAGVGHFYYVRLHGIAATVNRQPISLPALMEPSEPLIPFTELPEIIEIIGIKSNLTQAEINGDGVVITDDKGASGLWKSTTVQISWEVNIVKTGDLKIYLYLANEPEESGAEIEIEVAENKIYQKTESSGGLSNPLLMYMGQVLISSPGTIIIKLRATKIVKEFVGELQYILLSGSAAENAVFVTSVPELELPSKECLINGHGAILIGDEKIGEWTDTSVQFIWELELESVGQLSVSLVLANSPSQAGARIVITIGEQKLIGTTISSGGLKKTLEMPMGKVEIREIGKIKITVQAETIVGKYVGELYFLILKGSAAKGARLRTSFPQLQLDSSEAIISGSGANHVNNTIVDWTKTSVKIMWDITFENPGELYIYLALANTNNEAGSEIEIEIDNQHINGFTVPSGGKSNIQLMPIGLMNITSPGSFRLILKAKKITHKEVGELYYVLLKGTAAEGATSVKTTKGIDLKSTDCKISGPGALLRKDVITDWTEASAHIVWEVTLTKTGLLDISLAISNKPEQAGAFIEIKIGEDTIIGQTGSSGGMDHIQVMHMGTVFISTPGTVYIVVRALNISHVFVGNLHYLRISGPASEGAFIPEIPSSIRLSATTAIISGPGANHFGDEKITYWESESVKIMWEVTFTLTGKLSVYLELSNTAEEAHSRIEILIGPKKIVGTTVSTGGYSNIKEMLMGITTISNPGTYRITLRAEKIKHKFVGDLYNLILSGPAAKDATQTVVFPKVLLFPSDATIDGSGASYVQNKQIGAWYSTKVKIMWEINFFSPGDLYVALGMSNTSTSVGSRIQVSIEKQNTSILTRSSGSSREIHDVSVGYFSITKPGKYILTVQAINIVGTFIGDLHYIVLKGSATKNLKIAENTSGLQLNVSDCIITGSGAVLNNGFITSWSDTSTKIIWEVNFNSIGNLYIYIALANEPKDSGAKVKIFINDTSIEGTTSSTNGLNNIYLMAIGKIKISTPGLSRITIQASRLISKTVGDFYYLLLKGEPTEDIAVKKYAGVKLLAKESKISGKTTTLSGNKITNWIKPSTQIMWEVSLVNHGLLSISIGVVTSKENAGSEIEVQIGKTRLTGLTFYSGGESKITEINMGSVNITFPGTIMISVHANTIIGSSVGDLHYILLKGSASFGASIVKMSQELQLQASNAFINGHGAAHYGDEMISSWSNTNVTINWDVNFVQTGQLFLSVGLGNTEQEANARIEISVDNETITGTTIYSGGLTNPETMRIGYVFIKSPGVKRITLRADSIVKKEIGNLYYLVCEGTAARKAVFVDITHKLQLNTNDAIIDGNGAGFLENKYVGFWTNTNTKIVWTVRFNHTGDMYISVGLANTEKQIGSVVSVQIGKMTIQAPTIMSGGLDRIQLMPIGKIRVTKRDTYDITVRAKKINGNSVGNLYYILLKGPGAQDAVLVNANEGVDFQVSHALVVGRGINRIEYNKVSNWTGPSAMIKWSVTFPIPGSVYIYLHLENSNAQAGSRIITTVGNKSTNGLTVHPATNVYTLMHIGTLNIPKPGKLFVTLRADQIKSFGVGTMDKIYLKGSAINEDMEIHQFPIFQLNVSDAVIKGSGIHYDSKSNTIKGWKDSSTISWNINIPSDDWIEIWIALGNVGKQSVATIEVQIGKNLTKQTISFSEGVSKAKLIYIGSVYVTSLPNVKITLKGNTISGKSIGDLYYVQLRGIITNEISISSGEVPEVHLLPNNCKISGPGAIIENNTIIEWQSTDVFIQWEITFPSTGKFQVIIIMSAFSPGSVLEASIDGQTLNATINAPEVEMGTIEIRKPGTKTFTLRAVSIKEQFVGTLVSIKFRGQILLSTTVTVVKSLDSGTLTLNFEPDLPAIMAYNEITLLETYPMTYYAVLESNLVRVAMQEDFDGNKEIIISLNSEFPTSPNDEAIKVIRNAYEGRGEIFKGDTMTAYVFRYDYNWQTGKTYKFILYQYPSITGYVMTSVFFYHPGENAWKLLALVNRKFTETYMTNLHCYIRDESKQFGYKPRLTTFSPWIRITNGTWVEILSAAVDCPVEKGNGVGYVEKGVFVLKSGDGTIPCSESRKIYERSASVKFPEEIKDINEKIKLAIKRSQVITEVNTRLWEESSENTEENSAGQMTEQKQIAQKIQLQIEQQTIGSKVITYYWLITEDGQRRRISKEEFDQLSKMQSSSSHQQVIISSGQQGHQEINNIGSQMQMERLYTEQVTQGSQITTKYWLVSGDGSRREISKQEADAWMERYRSMLGMQQQRMSQSSSSYQQSSGRQVNFGTQMQTEKLYTERVTQGSHVTTKYWLVSGDGSRKEISKQEADAWMERYRSMLGMQQQRMSQSSSSYQQSSGHQVNFGSQMQTEKLYTERVTQGSQIITKYYLVSGDGSRREISKQEADAWMERYRSMLGMQQQGMTQSYNRQMYNRQRISRSLNEENETYRNQLAKDRIKGTSDKKNEATRKRVNRKKRT